MLGIEFLRSKLGLVKKEANLSHEMLLDGWIAQFPLHHRVEIASFLNRLESIQTRTKVRVGAIAIGSTARPENLRRTVPRDIDIKVLIQEEASSNRRALVVEFVQQEVERHLGNRGIEYSFYGIEEENYDPYEGVGCAFVARITKDSLPLHLHISGIHDWPMDEILEDERRQNRYFVRLR